MNIKILNLIAVNILLINASAALAQTAGPQTPSCMRVRWVMPEAEVPATQNPLPVSQATQATSVVASAVGALALSPVGVTQAGRNDLVVAVLDCTASSSFDTEPLSRGDSPLGLSMGAGQLQYHMGAVAGNWGLWGGIAGGLGVMALAKGSDSIRYPGILIIPEMFLATSTTDSSLILTLNGHSTERNVGFASLVGRLAITGCMIVAAYKVPSFSPELKQLSVALKDYRPGLEAFVVADHVMSQAVGILQALGAGQNDCNKLLYGAIGIWGAYSALLMGLRPHNTLMNKVAIIGLSTAQLGLLISHAAAKDSMKTVNAYTAVGLQWAGIAYNLVNAAMSLRSLHKYWRALKNPVIDSGNAILVNPLLQK